jgi:hypothetical protein
MPDLGRAIPLNTVEDWECWRLKFPSCGIPKLCSPDIVLEGELGVGGVLDCEDFGEFRAERENELCRRVFIALCSVFRAVTSDPV